MVLNLESLDWESSNLTTRPLLLVLINLKIYKTKINPSLDHFWGHFFGCPYYLIAIILGLDVTM